MARRRKTIGTEVGDIRLDQPRDRNSTFASAVVPKGARRLGELEDMIISLGCCASVGSDALICC